VHAKFEITCSSKSGHVKEGSLLVPDQYDPTTQLQDGGIIGNCSMSHVDGSSFASACCNNSFYSGTTDDSCSNDSCTSQHDENSDENDFLYSGTKEDGCNNSCTSNDDDNSDDQSFSTQGSNDSVAHSNDDSSDTQCDDDSADDAFVSQCSGNDNQNDKHPSNTTGVNNIGKEGDSSVADVYSQGDMPDGKITLVVNEDSIGDSNQSSVHQNPSRDVKSKFNGRTYFPESDDEFQAVDFDQMNHSSPTFSPRWTTQPAA
jgi:hypothetical protein